MPLSSRVAAIADDIPPLDAAYWQRRYEVERAAMKRAWEGGDLDYAIKNAKIYWRVEANAIGWASRPVPKPEPLTTECPRCESGTAFAGNHPGGGVRCEVCDGEGVVPICCEACHEPAVRWFQGNPLCMEHFEEWSADALNMVEDAPDISFFRRDTGAVVLIGHEMFEAREPDVDQVLVEFNVGEE